MTRFLPIDRPLVYGDIVSYQPADSGYSNKDRNVVLAPAESGASFLRLYRLLQITTPTGRESVEVIELPVAAGDWKLVEE